MVTATTEARPSIVVSCRVMKGGSLLREYWVLISLQDTLRDFINSQFPPFCHADSDFFLSQFFQLPSRSIRRLHMFILEPSWSASIQFKAPSNSPPRFHPSLKNPSSSQPYICQTPHHMSPISPRISGPTTSHARPRTPVTATQPQH